nr:NADH:ubiquinone reductase (Na(+)-transporting) subunit A [Xanthomonadales bacterium]NIN60409.1 NADH:ubiquinone reductase (Na(+)-transporting) subunit A [Xanthomonadales bacterium]NIN75762.1 NADH:ubiquinone reductase (Na(+)-transporting) subunit A [Xanthomonadales bacterium]NIO12940.1 NADH:ubiquinone reductase (Na(+)-transporting) subunit A [Xanthomonadales bacterium]NIP12802.1 NADH:ubiquinone reductase (Na(+)-transporting) subunit A [Xanthomonadales bacterium]
MRITLKHGIDFPRAGGIALDSAAAPPVASIALYADDYGSLRARPAVAVGDRVLAGMPVMRDRRHPEVALISPVTGRVREVRMGPRRSLQAVVVATDGAAPEALSVEASAADEAAIENIPRGQLRERLLASGLWAALRERPGDRVPPPDGHADAVLVRAMDTEPLAPDPLPLLGPAWQAFRAGLVALSRFAKHRVWVCTARRLEWPTA